MRWPAKTTQPSSWRHGLRASTRRRNGASGFAAASRGITQLFADVSLMAEPFFRKSGFVVEARQLVEVRGVVLANAQMYKELPVLYS